MDKSKTFLSKSEEKQLLKAARPSAVDGSDVLL